MKARRRLLIAGIVTGSLLMLSPIFGLLGTVFGMTRAFNTLGSSGIADPKALSDSIGATLFATAAGVFLFAVGVIVLTLSLIFTSAPEQLLHLLCPRSRHHEPGNRLTPDERSQASVSLLLFPGFLFTRSRKITGKSAASLDALIPQFEPKAHERTAAQAGDCVE